MHRAADAELNRFYGGCPNCEESELTVRIERLKFRKLAKVVQCSSCGAMFDERIMQDGATDYLELVRVGGVEEIEASRSSTNKELKRYSIREEMANRWKAQDTFGACPNCGETELINLKSAILTEKFSCDECESELKRRRWNSDWRMLSGADKLLGRTLSAIEWEQIAIEQTDDLSQPEGTEKEDQGEMVTSILEEDEDTLDMTEEIHTIPRGTWRGRVAEVLEKYDWMDSHEVSSAVTDSSRINYTLSKGGASNVLSDMYRHDDVVRQPSASGRTKYEYRLREDAVLE